MLPKSAMPRTSIITFEAAKLRTRKSRTSTTGCSWRHSQTTKATRATAETTAKRVMSESWNQSDSCPLSSTYSSAPSPTATRPNPT